MRARLLFLCSVLHPPLTQHPLGSVPHNECSSDICCTGRLLTSDLLRRDSRKSHLLNQTPLFCSLLQTNKQTNKLLGRVTFLCAVGTWFGALTHCLCSEGHCLIHTEHVQNRPHHDTDAIRASLHTLILLTTLKGMVDTLCNTFVLAKSSQQQLRLSEFIVKRPENKRILVDNTRKSCIEYVIENVIE